MIRIFYAYVFKRFCFQMQKWEWLYTNNLRKFVYLWVIISLMVRPEILYPLLISFYCFWYTEIFKIIRKQKSMLDPSSIKYNHNMFHPNAYSKITKTNVFIAFNLKETYTFHIHMFVFIYFYVICKTYADSCSRKR